MPVTRITNVLLAVLGVAGCALTLPAQRGGRGGNPIFQERRVLFEPGFRVYLVADMRGMGSLVDIRELVDLTESAPNPTAGNNDFQDRFRLLFTQEANAVVKGARAAGARSFVVNDAHPGNSFRSLLPWSLDTGAVLVRGSPRPLFAISGIDSTFGTLMFSGAVASAGSQGVLARTFALDSLRVNGVALNEVAVNALIAGEMGVSVSMVAGDDELIAETQKMLPGGFVPVVTKLSVGKMAAITYSPAKVRAMLTAGAAEAVRREKLGEFKPFTMAKPYRVEFRFAPAAADTGAIQFAPAGFTLERTGPRSFRFVTESARQIGFLVDAIERMVSR